ncbi:hypothetical protein K1X12_04385 [Hyphomonas sp. WL0036]|uniref:hypothetical protein n=1 Tax=Hyphomonas sediminis TaxID=2866160 RepID=UPI001C820BA5|nr:hypothetical protein [Hyphomonas sediminis]MBY9066123.1 hypothetical protein [Hyphomonas sediminis]
MPRFDELVATVEIYQALAEENYNRIRRLAEEVRSGLCDYLGASDGICVHLVPPAGPFEPRAYGDQAFSIPPRGFRPLGPVSFGLAVRVSKGQDWLRLVLNCRKTGDSFIVQIEEGAEYEFQLPIREEDAGPFNAHIYQHILDWFTENIERYREGSYGSRAIGFDFSLPESTSRFDI